MGGWIGLIELVLVLGAVLGFAVYELVKLRRYRERETAERSETSSTEE